MKNEKEQQKKTIRKKMRKTDFSKNSFFSNVEKIQSIRLRDVKSGYTSKEKRNLHTPWKIYIKRRRLLFFFLLRLLLLLLSLQFYGHFKR